MSTSTRNSRRSWVALALLTALTALSVAACTQDSEDPEMGAVAATETRDSLERGTLKQIVSGEKVFSATCSACHARGRNVIRTNFDLTKEALVDNGKTTIKSISILVKNGKNAMPAFAERLTAVEVEAVAAYVLSQAEGGWVTAPRAD